MPLAYSIPGPAGAAGATGPQGPAGSAVGDAVGWRTALFLIADESPIALTHAAGEGSSKVGTFIATWVPNPLYSSPSDVPFNLGTVGFVAAPGYDGSAGAGGQFRWSTGQGIAPHYLLLSYLVTA